MNADYELGFFLSALGYSGSEPVKAAWSDFQIQILDPKIGQVFSAVDHTIAIASAKINGGIHPFSLIYIPSDQPRCLGVTSLVHPEHPLRQKLEEIIPQFFQLNPLREIKSDWSTIHLLGVHPNPVFWEEKPEGDEYVRFFKKHFEKMPRLPVFPTVYPYNNPYAQKTFPHCLRTAKNGESILVMGCGASVEAAALALQTESEIHATDINALAVENTKLIAHICGVDDLVKAWMSDGYDAVQNKYDLIVLNAPLASDEDRPNDPNRFDAGGKFLKRILQNLPDYLKPEGRLLLMSRENISTYKPEFLESIAVEKFKTGAELGIHEIRLARQ